MANEVIANAERVVKLAWEGVQILQRLLDRYEEEIEMNASEVTQTIYLPGPWWSFKCREEVINWIEPSTLSSEVAAAKQSLNHLRLCGLVAEGEMILTRKEAELIGGVASRNFERDWADRFEREYGAAKE